MRFKDYFLFMLGLVLYVSSYISLVSAPHITNYSFESPVVNNLLVMDKINNSIELSNIVINDNYPKPDYVPTLRKYEINKDDDIWRAQDPSSYITPDNEWVKYYASQLYIEKDGSIKYKNDKIPRVINYTGEVLSWTNKPFINNYIYDDELFNYPANGDVWQNSDYYLTNGFKGDCEDWSITITSMMLSGEMSVIEQNGKFVKQVIPAKSVIGYMMKTRDVWTEYDIYNKTFISSTGYSDEGYGGNSITTFVDKNERNNLIPIFEFTDKYFRRL